MPLPSHWRTRRVSLLAIAACTAGLGCLSPAVAAAHGRAHLESAISEQLPTSPQPPATEPPAEPPAAEPPATTAPGGSVRHARREARHARRGALAGECSVELQATASILSAGEPLSLTGRLSCTEAASVAEQPVSLFQKLARTPGFNVLATTTTAADGSFQFKPEGLETNSIFYVRAGDAHSDRIAVKIAPHVTISAPLAGAQLFIGGAHAASGGTHAADPSIDDGSAVTFTGTVSPADSGATVSLQREYRRGAWHRIGGGGRVDDEGKYSIVHSFSRPGQANIRVVVHSHGLSMTSASAPVSYQLSRDRHRQITIDASANPLTYGQSVTITGTVAGAVGQAVTLWAQTGDQAFAPLAQATTNGNEYSFTESPLQNTRYRVRTASAGSAVFSEGVSFALTAEPPATTVPTGGQLSFTGTLLPSHEGQPVDLERRNPSGPGYHLIEVGTVSSTSTYSIAHTFSTAGPELLRISVPASPELQGVAGEPFAVDVTPIS